MSAGSRPVIVGAVRSGSGRGRAGAALNPVHPVELLAQVLTALVERTGLDPVLVDDVLVGCVSQVGEQSTCPGRIAWLAAGLPESVPATTIDRRCGSGQQAVHFGAQGVAAGAYDAVVVGGVESMSRIPMFSARGTTDPWGPSVTDRYAPGLVPQGISAELIAARRRISRPEMDEFAARSHALAAGEAASGAFAAEIVPIEVPGAAPHAHDETVRADADADAMAGLPPAFRDEEVSRRFPEITWSITAGNSSPLTDGAAAMLVTSEDFARRHGLSALATIEGGAVAAGSPIAMLDAIVPATEKLLAREHVRPADMDRFEVNEAFACVPLMWQREFEVPVETINPQGGAIALGHALGASGARIMTTLVHGMAHRGERLAVQTMCEGSGMANATLIRSLA